MVNPKWNMPCRVSDSYIIELHGFYKRDSFPRVSVLVRMKSQFDLNVQCFDKVAYTLNTKKNYMKLQFTRPIAVVFFSVHNLFNIVLPMLYAALYCTVLGPCYTLCYCLILLPYHTASKPNRVHLHISCWFFFQSSFASNTCLSILLFIRNKINRVPFGFPFFHLINFNPPSLSERQDNGKRFGVCMCECV